MSQFVVRGTIKSGVAALVGATVKVVDKQDRVLATQLTVEKGEYVTDPLDLIDKEHYMLIVNLLGYSEKQQPFQALQGKFRGAPDFVNGVKGIVISPTLEKAKVADDPFKDCRLVLTKNGPYAGNPPDSDHTFFTVEIGNTPSKTGIQIRQELLVAEPAPTWEKDFDGVTWELVKNATKDDLLWKSPRGWKPTDAVPEGQVSLYDITENNKSKWDWILWETEGNSSGKYRRGGKTRKLGLYKLDYDKLRKADKDRWQPPQPANALGGGWVTVAVLESLDYSKHEWLIKTFLPCFSIDANGKVTEPGAKPSSGQPIPVSRLMASGNEQNTIDDQSLSIVMPFNYDDNGERSRVIGKNLSKGVFPKVGAERLTQELDRWATASRSTITAFPKQALDLSPHGKTEWPLRPAIGTEPSNNDENPPIPPTWAPQINGPADGKALREFQEGKRDSSVYYSVKTGVQYVSLMNQMSTKKDMLEENSIHAMNRSNLINAVVNGLKAHRFEARYQIEVLCILIDKDPDGSKEIEKSPELLVNEVLLEEGYLKRQKVAKQLAEKKEVLSKAADVAKSWQDLKSTQDYKSIPELLNASALEKLLKDFSTMDTIDNLEEATDFKTFEIKVRAVITKLESADKDRVEARREAIEHKKASVGFDGIQVREISNAGQNAIWFPALAIPSHGKAFVEHWAQGQDWLEFWLKNFAIPMGRAKAEMLLFFGMQHMTSNSQNFLIAFDRNPGGNNGRLQHLILRDIGDTLYNDHVFNVLKDMGSKLSPLYLREWNHESNDRFGVTLSSDLGSYASPIMTRSGAAIVFFFGPFIEGDIKSDPKCANILAGWCIEHDKAFLQYMRENLGYTNEWKAGDDTVSEDFGKKVRVHAVLNASNAIAYPKLVKNILDLAPPARWRLIGEIEAECQKLKGVADVDTANKLVNAHDILIGAEVQCYLQDEQGKAALRRLHQGSGGAASASTSGFSSASHASLTRVKFDSLAKGMSYQEAVGILGSEGKDVSPSSSQTFGTKAYRWDGTGKASISAIFSDTGLISKTQQDLQ